MWWWSKAKYRSRYMLLFPIVLIIIQTPIIDAARVNFDFQAFFYDEFLWCDTRTNYVRVWICRKMDFSFRAIVNEHQAHYVVSDV